MQVRLYFVGKVKLALDGSARGILSSREAISRAKGELATADDFHPTRHQYFSHE